MKRVTFFLLLILFSSIGWSNPTLLDSLERPTVEQILANQKELAKFPRKHTLTSADRYLGNGHASLAFNYTYWLDSLLAGGPKFIAQIEKAFPGATWAFMGRDSAVLADMVEAFYLYIGQKNRVVRVGMSKETLSKSSAEQFEKYIEELGFDFNDLHNKNPFILIDTVSSGFGRQGRALLKIAYARHAKEGGHPAELLNMFNMIGVVVSTFNDQEFPISRSETYLEQMKVKIANTPNAQIDFDSEQLLTYNEQKDYFGEAGYEHYTGAWHQSFKGLIATNGRVSAQPGKLLDEKYRINVLQFQLDIIERVMTDEFLERVRQEADDIDFKFPMKRAKSPFRRLNRLGFLKAEHDVELQGMKQIDKKFQIGKDQNLRTAVQVFFKSASEGPTRKSVFNTILEEFRSEGRDARDAYEWLRELSRFRDKEALTSQQEGELMGVFVSYGVFSNKFYDRVNEITTDNKEAQKILENLNSPAGNSIINRKKREKKLTLGLCSYLFE